jgi:hypothetical protein
MTHAPASAAMMAPVSKIGLSGCCIITIPRHAPWP